MRSLRFTAMLLVASTAIMLGGCMKKTPEQQLEKVYNMIQQQDTLGARLACQDIIKNYPNAAESKQARLFLAKIYIREEQPDEALSELTAIMETTSQHDPLGQQALQEIVGLEMKRGNTDKALGTIDGILEKDGKNDTSLKQGLLILKGNVLMSDSKTTDARAIIAEAAQITTATDVLDMLDDMELNSYMQENSLDLAKNLLKTQIDKAKNDIRKFDLMTRMTALEFQHEDYEQCRASLVNLTAIYDKMAKDELDIRKRQQLYVMLLGAYAGCGNYKACETLLSKSLSETKDLKEAQYVSQGVASMMMRQGNTSGVLELLSELSTRFPNGPFAEERTRLESTLLSGPSAADFMDTRPIVLKFKEDELILPTYIPSETETSATEPLQQNIPSTSN